MQLRKLPGWAAKLACAVFCADFLTMLLMNIFRLYTHWLPVLFFALLLAAGFWAFRSGMLPVGERNYMPPKEQSLLVLLFLGAALLFSGMRFSYLMEGHLHHLVAPIVSDDIWHFQEINSLVNSARYPAHYNLIPGRYFSLYYAPWMLIAALYLALPVDGFTIKAAFAVGYAIYEVLLCLTLLYIGLARARSRRHLYWAIYLIGCWAGISSLFALLHPLQGYGWAWTMNLGMPLMFSNFEVCTIWSVHHLSAAVALLLCWHIWDTAEKQKWQTIITCSLLICYCIYSSIFVFLGAFPFGVFVTIMALRGDWRPVTKIMCLSGIMVWPLLWIYLGKSSSTKFLFPFITHIQFSSRHFTILSRISGGAWFGLCIFLVLLCMNYLPQFLALVVHGKKLAWKNKILLGFVLAFLISTYFIGFTEGNNYATRGSLVPLMVLGWLCAGLLPELRTSIILIFVLFLGAFGSMQEVFWTYGQTLQSAHTSPAGKYGPAILAINEDRHARAMPIATLAAALKDDPDSIYSMERFVPGGKTNLVPADLELECLGPRGPWRWESIPEAPMIPSRPTLDAVPQSSQLPGK